MRQAYEEAQAKSLGGSSYAAYLVPRIIAFRVSVLACEVAKQLEGFDARRHSRFHEAIMKFSRALNESLPDISSRRKAFENARAVVDGGADAVCKYLSSHANETRRAVRENKVKERLAKKQDTPESAPQSKEKQRTSTFRTA